MAGLPADRVVLFENSIVCLVVFVCCFFAALLAFSRVGGVVCFGQVFSDCLLGFCLESLILAQDERWRRA